jgi:hypothetical protein
VKDKKVGAKSGRKKVGEIKWEKKSGREKFYDKNLEK